MGNQLHLPEDGIYVAFLESFSIRAKNHAYAPPVDSTLSSSVRTCTIASLFAGLVADTQPLLFA